MRLRIAYRPSQVEARMGAFAGSGSGVPGGPGLWLAEGLADGDSLTAPPVSVDLDPLQSGLIDLSVGGPSFSVGIPGDLGPYVGVPKERFRLDAEAPLATRLSRSVNRRAAGGYGSGGLGRPERADVVRVADEVLAHAQARAMAFRFNPSAWFRERGFSAESLQGYLSLAHLARVRNEFEWGPFGWEIRGSSAGRERADDWAKRAAGWGVADTLKIEEWDLHRMAILAMRFLTAEQAGLMMPESSMASVNESLRDWVMSGYLEPFSRVPKQSAYLVTGKAVREAMADGIVEAWEERSRRSVRRGQELHDLAVNDAILVMALLAEAEGESVTGLLTEAAFFAMGERAPYPDFRLVASREEEELSGRAVQVAVKHDVEVVGLGANYRRAAKLGRIQQAGFRLFVPGYDGLGVRFGR